MAKKRANTLKKTPSIDSREFKEKLHIEAMRIISLNALSGAKWKYKKLTAKLSQLPIDQQSEAYLIAIKNEIEKQDEHFLILEEEDKKSMIEDFFSTEEYELFQKGKLNMLRNNLIKQHIVEESRVLLIKMLNKEYSKNTSTKPGLNEVVYMDYVL